MPKHLPIGRGGVGLVFAFTGASLLVALAGTSCGQLEDNTAPTIRDASRPDAKVDAGPDASLDYEANPWQGTVPAPGDWEPMVGLPKSCPIRVAKDASKSIPAFSWRPCPSGREGCQSFLADWSPSKGGPSMIYYSTEPVFEVAGVPAIAYGRWGYGKDPSDVYSFSTVQRLHAAASHAVFYQSTIAEGCFTIPSASAFGFATIATIDRPQLVEVFVATAPVFGASELSAVRITDQLGSKKVVQTIGVGSGYLTFEQVNFGAGVYASLFDTSAQRVVFPGVANRPLDAERPFPVQGGYVAYVLGDPNTIDFMPTRGGHQPVVRPLQGQQLAFLTVDRGDNDALYWEEVSAANDTGPVTLYTSPFSTSETGLRRRAVATFSKPTYGVVNKGHFAYALDDQRARILRTSDGLGWDVAGEPGVPIMRAAWVNDESVWFFTSHLQRGEPGYPSLGGMIEILRSTLGPPAATSAF